MATSVVGKAVTRVDGRLKVTGRGGVCEWTIPLRTWPTACRWPAPSAAGRSPASTPRRRRRCRECWRCCITATRSRSSARRSRSSDDSHPGESRPPFEDDTVYYYGQFVALVVANTLQQAQEAARRVKVRYDAKTPLIAST